MTLRGKFVLTVIILGIAALGAVKWWDKLNPTAATASSPTQATAIGKTSATAPVTTVDEAEFVAALTGCPLLPPPAAYILKDNTVDLELSEYAGYSGIIVANGGLEPSENSYFYKKHGFKVRIKLSEEES